MKKRLLLAILPVAVSIGTSTGTYATEAMSQAYAAAKNGLLMRTAPQRTAAQVASIPYGAKVMIHERSANSDTVEGKTSPWFKIYWVDLAGKDRDGWVFGGFLATTPLAGFHRIATGRFQSFEMGDYGHVDFKLENGSVISLFLFGPAKLPDGFSEAIQEANGGRFAGKRLRIVWAKRTVFVPENDGPMEIEALDEVSLVP
jgi:hypothetical protein